MTDSSLELKSPRMLLIGAAGRDAGKTYFATSLLRQFTSANDIVAVKVTPIEKVTDRCPHGRDDCNVCATLKGNFEIAEETDPEPDKDTCKMLAAGAKRVFWLRSLKSHLKAGAAAMLEATGSSAVLICESNSLRTVVEPGLFVMLKNRSATEPKPSSRAVLRHIDRIVLFDGAGFDIDFDDFSVTPKGWTLAMDATAIILAGGDAARMGRDKATLPIGGKPMIKHIYDQIRPWFSEVIISSNEPDKHAFLGAPVVADEKKGHGPLMGIASAIKASNYDRNFVIACDIPNVDIALMLKLLRQSRDCDGCVPRLAGAKYEPLFAVYRKSMLKTIHDLLTAGERKIDRAYDLCKMDFVDIAPDRGINNINTKQDYLELTTGEKEDAP